MDWSAIAYPRGLHLLDRWRQRPSSSGTTSRPVGAGLLRHGVQLLGGADEPEVPGGDGRAGRARGAGRGARGDLRRRAGTRAGGLALQPAQPLQRRPDVHRRDALGSYLDLGLGCRTDDARRAAAAALPVGRGAGRPAPDAGQRINLDRARTGTGQSRRRGRRAVELRGPQRPGIEPLERRPPVAHRGSLPRRARGRGVAGAGSPVPGHSVSVPADEHDERLVAGRPIREWYVGPNFFPNYALDHHGYLNVGYQVICLSNAAMLHFDLKAMGAEAPESLHHHQADLWDVVRRLVFADGRLARIGGDSRVRYAYCQEYLLPSLAYAADQFGDHHAAELAAGQVGWTAAEAEHHGDGSFYGSRLAYLAASSPYYLTRLESTVPARSATGAVRRTGGRSRRTCGAVEASVAGGWPSRSTRGDAPLPTRLASVAWRAYGLTQAICQPPDDGHLADWCLNLAARIRALGTRSRARHPGPKRKWWSAQSSFDGGFVTWGTVLEGCGVIWPRLDRASSARHGWPTRAPRRADHDRVQSPKPSLTESISGRQGAAAEPAQRPHNGFVRRLETAAGEPCCPRGGRRRGRARSRWAVLDRRSRWSGSTAPRSCGRPRRPPRGARRVAARRATLLRSSTRSIRRRPRAVLDVTWAVIAAAGRPTRGAGFRRSLPPTPRRLRAVTVTGQDRVSYVLAVNLGTSAPSGQFADRRGRVDLPPDVLAPGKPGMGCERA